jgi:cysteine peptidase C11 family protein
MSTKKAIQSMNGKEELNPMAKWTVMVYFAADNDLEEEAIADLKEMKKVESTDEVNIVAQLDSRDRGKTFRFLIGDDQTTLDEDVVEELPEINTGDPRELTNFIVWGADTYKAENYMVVLWGHSPGPLPLDLDNSNRAAVRTTDVVVYRDDSARGVGEKKRKQIQGSYSVAMTRRNEIRTLIQSATKVRKIDRSLQFQLQRDEFGRQEIQKRLQSQNVSSPQGNGDHLAHSLDQSSSKMIDSPRVTGLLLDENSGSEISQDVLKMDELEFALAMACERSERLKNRKINILGMDVCLMGTAEVGYQIQDYVEYLVASEDAILNEGWPYERILARLIKNSDMLPEEFSITIIREFLLHYREQNRDATKSACNLSKSSALAKCVMKLAKMLTDKIPDVGGIAEAILASRAMAQSFFIKDYVDLYDFCSHLSQRCKDEDIGQLCRNLMEVIHGNEPNADDPQPTSQSDLSKEHLVLDYGFIGHRLSGSNGVSIYFPCFDPSQKYAELSFAANTHWDKFLDALAARLPSNGSFEIHPVFLVETSESPGENKSGLGTPQKIERGTRQRMPKPLPRKKPKYPVTQHEEPIPDKSVTKRKKEAVKK